ncbi:MAG: hypothetical protein Q4E24_09435 [bacterium]|nr:hypothetical protein [bacterium]
MNEFKVRTEWLGYPIEASVSILDDGLHILLTGGCRTHVGAISRAVPKEETHTIQYPTHRDGLVSETWASALSSLFRQPVVVCCGIHYDNVSREDIQQIVKKTDELLQSCIQCLPGYLI